MGNLITPESKWKTDAVSSVHNFCQLDQLPISPGNVKKDNSDITLAGKVAGEIVEAEQLLQECKDKDTHMC